MTQDLDALPLPEPALHIAFSNDGEHIRFWTSSAYCAAVWSADNWPTEPMFSAMQYRAAHREGYELAKREARAPKSDEASEVLALLDSGEWELTRHPDTDSMLTDEWCAKNRWSVRRTTAPFCGRDGVRCWSAPTPLEAFAKAHAALAAQQKGGE